MRKQAGGRQVQPNRFQTQTQTQMNQRAAADQVNRAVAFAQTQKIACMVAEEQWREASAYLDKKIIEVEVMLNRMRSDPRPQDDNAGQRTRARESVRVLDAAYYSLKDRRDRACDESSMAREAVREAVRVQRIASPSLPQPYSQNGGRTRRCHGQ